MPRKPKVTTESNPNKFAPLRFIQNSGRKGEKSTVVLTTGGRFMDLWSGKSIGFGKLLRGKK